MQTYLRQVMQSQKRRPGFLNMNQHCKRAYDDNCSNKHRQFLSIKLCCVLSQFGGSNYIRQPAPAPMLPLPCSGSPAPASMLRLPCSASTAPASLLRLLCSASTAPASLLRLPCSASTAPASLLRLHSSVLILQAPALRHQVRVAFKLQ